METPVSPEETCWAWSGYFLIGWATWFYFKTLAQFCWSRNIIEFTLFLWTAQVRPFTLIPYWHIPLVFRCYFTTCWAQLMDLLSYSIYYLLVQRTSLILLIYLVYLCGSIYFNYFSRGLWGGSGPVSSILSMILVRFLDLASVLYYYGISVLLYNFNLYITSGVHDAFFIGPQLERNFTPFPVILKWRS